MRSKTQRWERLDREDEGGRAMDPAAMVMMFCAFCTKVRGDFVFFCVVGDLNLSLSVGELLIE